MNSLPIPEDSQTKPLPLVLIASPKRFQIEKSYTVKEVAAMYSWSYIMTYRHFRDLPGVLVKVNENEFRNIKRFIRIPESVVEREWKRLTSYNDLKAA